MSDTQESIDQGFMQLALHQAQAAAQAGEVPVGAVVVHQGQVIASAHNSPVGSKDPCAHAEVHALRAAAQVRGNYRLEDCTLYVTLEPCVMCSGAALAARLQRVVYGASEPKTGAAGSVLNVFAQPQLNHRTQITAGVMAVQSTALLQAFFAQRRSWANAHRVPLREDALRLDASRIAQLEGLGVPGPWSRYTQSLPSLQGLRLHWLSNGIEASAESEMQIFLHGPETWSACYLEMLGSDVPAVALDLPGFGLSDKPKKDAQHTLAWHAQVLTEFIALHQAKAVHLFAPASVRALLALQQPIASLALICHDLPEPAPISEALRAAPYPDQGHQAGPRAWRTLLAGSAPGP